MIGASRLAELGTIIIGEAKPEARLLDFAFRPLATDMRVVGLAQRVRCRSGDNLALHRSIAAGKPGAVIVADYGGAVRNTVRTVKMDLQSSRAGSTLVEPSMKTAVTSTCRSRSAAHGCGPAIFWSPTMMP